ncbi:hypothetical protein GCM10022393_36260 [Aquimarina addita]|uniref:Beta-lactamase-related domain-containing protein n=1 Tax=Aquimarina addita TaxID=870485 RepID=A0ABP6UR20_9FLAO
MKNQIICLLLVIFSISCKNTTDTNENQGIQNMEKDTVTISMDTNAAAFLEDSTVTAISIGVYKNGKSYTGHYGELDRQKGNPPTDSTFYEIASVTKTFTGTLVAQAILDGKLSLEDDIRKYLDGDYNNLQYDGHPILIKHVLTHTARLPSNNKGIDELFKNEADSLAFKFNEIEKNYNKEKYFSHLQEITLDTLPGTKYNYSNVGANLMGHILEVVYKKSFTQLLDQFILKKSGMNTSKMILTEEESNRLANGYNNDGDLMPHLPVSNTLWGAEGGLKSTMPDMIKYMQFQMDSTNAVAQESHKKIHKENATEWIGYFWRVEQDEDGIYYHHHGGAFGANTYFFIYPHYNLGIVASTNCSGRIASANLKSAVDGLLDDLKPFGKKSISRAITTLCFEDIDKGITYYHQLKKEKPEGYNFEKEGELNSLGYALLRKGEVKAAIKIFTLLVAEFPEAFNPYDSLGEGYFEDKNYQMSLLNYEKSLALNPENDNAKMMIDKIKNNKEK